MRDLDLHAAFVSRTLGAAIESEVALRLARAQVGTASLAVLPAFDVPQLRRHEHRARSRRLPLVRLFAVSDARTTRVAVIGGLDPERAGRVAERERLPGLLACSRTGQWLLRQPGQPDEALGGFQAAAAVAAIGQLLSMPEVRLHYPPQGWIDGLVMAAYRATGASDADRQELLELLAELRAGDEKPEETDR